MFSNIKERSGGIPICPIINFLQMNKIILFFALVIGLQTSCVVQSPKYTTVEQVMSIKIGMSKAQVEAHLGIQPYDIKMYNDTSIVFIYIYRVTDRRTFSFNTQPVNGKESIGKYVQLDITYSMEDKVTSIETCRICPDNLINTSKIKFDKILLFVTVTLPVILIYLGVQ